MRDEFSTFDICKALQIPKGRLREWIVENFVRPTVPAEGVGTRAVFTREDIYHIELFRQLVDFGLKRGNISLFFEFMKSNSNSNLIEDIDIWKGAIIFIRDGKLFACTYYNYKELMSIRTAQTEDEREPLFEDVPLITKKTRPQGHPGKYLSQILSEDHLDRWDQIFIFNFENIKQKVDMALSALE